MKHPHAATSVRLVAALLAVTAAGASIAAQQRTLTVVVTGQTMIQADLRVHTPSVVTSLKPVLAGDVVFTNFEGSVVEPDQHGPGPNVKSNVSGAGVDSL